MKPLRKAVIPAAGFGTRFLPFTKAVPKEMIPLVDKPVIQYVVEEAAAAGITDVCIVVSAGKQAIQAHFNPVFDLMTRLEATGKTAELNALKAIDSMVRIQYVYQQEMLGLGHAVLQAESFVGSDPFAILLGDTVTASGSGCGIMQQLADCYARTGCSVTAMQEVPREKTSRYGIIDCTLQEGQLYKVSGFVEKPSPETAPSNFAVAARYVFTPEIFGYLHAGKPGKGGEIQLTDAMAAMLKDHDMYSCRIDGKRYDIGNKLDFVKSTLEFAMNRPDMRDVLLPWIKEFVKNL